MRAWIIYAAITACCSTGTFASNSQLNKGDKNMKSGILFENFDESIRPQDDFFNYVNGGWLKKEKIPEDKTTIGSFFTLRDKSQEDVKSIIKSLTKKNNSSASFGEQQVLNLYQSFMDADKIESLGLEPIQSQLAAIDAIENKDQLASYFAKSSIIGNSSPIGFFISVDDKDSTRYIAKIWQDGLGMPDRDYYLKNEEKEKNIREYYLKHIEKMFLLADLPESEKSPQTILNLEKQLAKFNWTNVENRETEKLYNKFSIEKLSDLAPDFNWNAYLQTLGIENEENIIIAQPSYIQGFNNIFKDLPMEQWKIYLKWVLLRENASYLTAALDNANFDFYKKKLQGQLQQQARWKRAVDLINHTIGEVIGKLYVDIHFKPTAKKRMMKLISDLQTAFDLSFTELDWMSRETVEAAKAKLNQFTHKIGYPNQWKDYSSLIIKKDDLIGNIIRINQDAYKKAIKKLGGPILKWEWFINPQTVNAYYNPRMNEIVFPAAILQPPFFDFEADDAVNYGAIGAVIGHEMGHGFDDQGSKYDGLGNMKNWWQDADRAAFKEKTKKLIEQYNQFKIFDDLSVNGELTLGENIGDLSGLTIAYKAYQISLNGKEEPIIDGLTGTQRFLIGYTQIWCIKRQEARARILAKTDPHSPERFRVLGPLSNMDQFYDAFNVQPGDKMYLPPEQRVKMWQSN